MPVAQKTSGASPFGLLDMAGNAFEWCADWYSASYYASAPAVDPKGPATGKLRVIRGGAWISLPDACRCATRASFRPESAGTLIGFRVAMIPEPSTGLLVIAGLVGFAAQRRRAR